MECKRGAQNKLRSDKKFFYHPDYTVGFGLAPNQERVKNRFRRRLMPPRTTFMRHGNHCRWGIAPRPKELTLKTMFTKIQRGPRTEFFVSLRGASSPLLRYARLSYYIIAAIPPLVSSLTRQIGACCAGKPCLQLNFII